MLRRHRMPPQPREWKITDACLAMIAESAKSTYPKEFGALLRVDEVQKDTIIEVVLLPGTISGDAHAIFQLHMLPIDFSVVGTVHSHPSAVARPSDADLDLFGHFGKVHLIVGVAASGKVTWRAYDYEGRPVSLSVV